MMTDGEEETKIIEDVEQTVLDEALPKCVKNNSLVCTSTWMVVLLEEEQVLGG